MATVAESLVVRYSQYTRSAAFSPATVFPNHGMQTLSSAITLLGITILTYCFARRSDYEGLWTWKGVKEIPWPRLCVSLLFLDSWIFVFVSGLLISGAGLSTNELNCSLGIFACIIFYASSKLLIYLFLIEKVYIVWASRGTSRTPRWKTPIFRFCIILILPLAGVLVSMILGHIAELRSTDRVCIIGLKRAASLFLLCYDLFMTVVLNTLFVYPLLTSNVSTRVKKVASRTLIASMAALITSCINIAVLTIVHGRELGWICLSSCGTDVTLNAIAVYWVTKTTQGTRVITKDSITPPVQSARATSVSGQSGDESENKSHTNVRFPKHIQSHSKGDGPVPAHILASRRVTHFAEDSRADRFTSEMRVEGQGAQSPGILSGLLSSFRAKSTPVEEHVMSVQVTVTTEQQFPKDQIDDDKYDHSSDSEIDAEMPKPKSKTPSV